MAYEFHSIFYNRNRGETSNLRPYRRESLCKPLKEDRSLLLPFVLYYLWLRLAF